MSKRKIERNSNIVVSKEFNVTSCMKIMSSQSSNENSISRIKKDLLKFRARRVLPSKSPQLTSPKKC